MPPAKQGNTLKTLALVLAVMVPLAAGVWFAIEGRFVSTTAHAQHIDEVKGAIVVNQAANLRAQATILMQCKDEQATIRQDVAVIKVTLEAQGEVLAEIRSLLLRPARRGAGPR